MSTAEMHFGAPVDAIVYAASGSITAATSLLTGNYWTGRVVQVEKLGSGSVDDSSAHKVLDTYSGNPDCCLLGAKGEKVAVGTDDGSLLVWSPAGGSDQATSLDEHGDTVSGVSAHPTEHTCVASSSWDGTVKIWNVEGSGSSSKTLVGHIGFVNCVKYDPKGASLASGSQDGTVRLWDAKEGRCTRTLYPAAAGARSVDRVPIYDLSWSPDANGVLACAMDDGSVVVLDTRAGGKDGAPRRIALHARAARRVAFCPQDASVLASASDDWTAATASAADGKVRKVVRHGDCVRAVAWHPGRRGVLATGSWDRTVREQEAL
eukprot:tig00020934_g16121.t1